MADVLSLSRLSTRTRWMIVAGLLIAGIAVLDLVTAPYMSLGLLYVFPIMVLGGFLSRTQTIVIALICAVLQEAFSNLPANDAIVRLAFSSVGFIGTGLFISELVRNRRIALTHLEQLESQIKLREDAEEQLHILVESSPAAIVTIDSNGEILLANHAAHQLLAPDASTLRGQFIDAYLPALLDVIQANPGRVFRTALQCKGQRRDGEVFLAAVWFSTYTTIAGPRLAAIIVDLSEDLRSREDLSLDRLLRNTKILMSAVTHEVRNLSSAALVLYKNLSRVKMLEKNEDFRALRTLLESLEKVVSTELQPVSAQAAAEVDLGSVLDELRVLVETEYRESGMEIRWQIDQALPLVWADRYGLVQVFLNLAKNSQRAMQSSDTKRLSVSASREGERVVVRFEDTGVGLSSAEHLFRPFQPHASSTGLGLYVSRATMRSFGGDLIHEPRAVGCCFAAFLTSVSPIEETADVSTGYSDSLAR